MGASSSFFCRPWIIYYFGEMLDMSEVGGTFVQRRSAVNYSIWLPLTTAVDISRLSEQSGGTLLYIETCNCPPKGM